MEGKIGIWEILLIVGIALLLFGPSKFASLGKSIGEGLRNFKSAMKEEPRRTNQQVVVPRRSSPYLTFTPAASGTPAPPASPTTLL